jgi:serine/threonine protein kinase
MPVTAQSPSIEPHRLLRELTAARLLTEDQAALAHSEIQSAAAGECGKSFTDFLVAAGLLTKFQAERVRLGDVAKLALGPYLLLEPVGTGSLGVVYRAIHRDTRKRYAVKVLPLRSLWNVLQAKKRLEEFAALPPHPALVPFVDIDTANGSHYLVWPFVEGGTFETLVRRSGPLDPGTAADYMAEVADALAVCHAHGMPHGLLKPSNLMLDPDRRPRVLDFGMGAILAENLADQESLLDTISTANTTRGSLECSAPETTANPTLRTPAADAYAFGCILYYVLTGVYPFPDATAVFQIIAHQTEEPVPAHVRNPNIPEPLARLVEHLMKKNPAERPQSLEPVRDTLRAVADLAGTPPPVAVLPPLPAPRDASPESVNFNIPESDGSSLIQPPVPQPIVLQARLSGSVGGAPKRSKRGTKFNLELPPVPVDWSEPGGVEESVFSDVPPPPNPFMARFWKVVRFLFGWVAPRDVVQLSVFGPPGLAPGQTARLLVYAHPPTVFSNVRTMSKAFLQDNVLLATGYSTQLVPRGRALALHLAVSNAGVAKPLFSFRWEGQTRPTTFDVFVPWESPAGKAAALVSAGVDNVEAARIPFEAVILPRSG